MQSQYMPSSLYARIEQEWLAIKRQSTITRSDRSADGDASETASQGVTRLPRQDHQ